MSQLEWHPYSEPKAIKEVGSALKDSESAKWKDVKAMKPIRTYEDSFINITCGYVNAKNGFGAYGGFIPFMHFEDTNERTEIQFITDDQILGWGEMWNSLCDEMPKIEYSLNGYNSYLDEHYIKKLKRGVFFYPKSSSYEAFCLDINTGNRIDFGEVGAPQDLNQKAIWGARKVLHGC